MRYVSVFTELEISTGQGVRCDGLWAEGCQESASGLSSGDPLVNSDLSLLPVEGKDGKRKGM